MTRVFSDNQDTQKMLLFWSGRNHFWLFGPNLGGPRAWARSEKLDAPRLPVLMHWFNYYPERNNKGGAAVIRALEVSINIKGLLAGYAEWSLWRGGV